MTIKIEMEINHCYECPFTVNVRELGYSSTDCSKGRSYRSIPVEGIREDCPFKKQTALDKTPKI